MSKIKNLFLPMLLSLCSMVCLFFSACSSDDDSAPTPSLSVPVNHYNVSQNGETLKVSLSTNQTNIYVCVDGYVDWIEFSSITPQSISLSIDKNEELYARTASVIIVAGSLSETITVTQQGGKMLTLSQTEYTISESGGKVYIDTESNFKYEVSVDADWVQEASNTSRAMSKSTIALNVLPNEYYDSREAKITLSDPSSEVRKTLTIIQSQKNAIVLAKNNYEIDKEGGEISFEVGANVDYEIEVGDSWVSHKASRALSYKNVTFVVSPNPKAEERETTISLTNKKLDKEQVIRIKQMAGVSGTIGGHDYVDLGLPSGIKWATCNVGASSPGDEGNYYAWGETTPKSSYDWGSYKWGRESYIYKYFAYPSPIIDGVYYVSGTQDGRSVLEPCDDAASVNWGSPWRMPTDDEINELVYECTWTSSSWGHKPGHKVTGPNGNSIFLPNAGYYESEYGYNHSSLFGLYGYYWSSTLSKTIPNSAYYFLCQRGNAFVSDHGYRLYGYRASGLSVRAVCP